MFDGCTKDYDIIYLSSPNKLYNKISVTNYTVKINFNLKISSLQLNNIRINTFFNY